MVGSSFHSAANGFPTGSAGLLSLSTKTFSKSQANSASASLSSSLPPSLVVDAAPSTGGGISLSAFFVSLTGLGVCCRELGVERGASASFLRSPRPRCLFSLPRRLCLFLAPLSRSLRRSRWSLDRECAWPLGASGRHPGGGGG